MRPRFPVERGLVGAIFVFSVAARVYASGQRVTPLFYPDEYIYTALARSIASTGVPRIRGDVLHLSSVLVPYLMSPGWLIGNVNTAYHVVLAVGAVSFSAAVFPAYALARRLGITPRGAVVVALLAVLVPDAALATNAMTEPYAYPIFLVTLLVAIDAIVSPTLVRQLGVLSLMAVLCLARVQFGFVLVLYLLAALIHERSLRRLARRQPVVTAVIVGALAVVAVIGPSKLVGFYSFPTSWSLLFTIWGWLGVNLFVVTIAAGWVVFPGAVIGFGRLVRSGDPARRTFAFLALGCTLALGLQAAYVDALQHRVHERYVFYVVPLIAIAFMWYLEATVLNRRRYALAAYVAAVAAILVPATEWLRDAGSDQSPTLLGLQELAGSGSIGHLVWAVGLAALAIAVGLLRWNSRVPLTGAVVISAVLCASGTRALIQLVPTPEAAAAGHGVNAFRLAAPANSALLAWAGTDRFALMKTQFWTPKITRVLMIGGGEAPDGFASTAASFRPASGIVDSAGRPIPGPFAFGPNTTVLSPASTPATEWLSRAPEAVLLGLNRRDHWLATANELVMAADDGRPLAVTLGLRAEGSRTLTFGCRSRKFDVRLGRAAQQVRITSGPTGLARCRISLTKGAAVMSGSRITSGVHVTRFALERPAS